MNDMIEPTARALSTYSTTRLPLHPTNYNSRGLSTMKALTDTQIVELDALRQMNDATKTASFIVKSFWHGQYQLLVRRGLVRWRQHPTMGSRYRAIEITPKGREFLSETEIPELPEEDSQP